MLSHIEKKKYCKCVYKNLGLSNYCQLVLVVTSSLLDIKVADLSTCEAKWIHVFHVTQGYFNKKIKFYTMFYNEDKRINVASAYSFGMVEIN